MQALKLLLATPFMWVWYALLAALILLRGVRKQRHIRVGWYLLVVGFLLLNLFSFTPVSDMLTQPLVRWYSTPSAETLARVEAITVLGGGVSQGEPSSATYSRVMGGIRLFKASNAKFFVVQGAAEIPGEPTNAEVMRKIALEQGVPEGEILADLRSRTTEEHPAQLEALLPKGVARIGVVTSALHMPRAIAIFQKYFPDKTIVPLPVGVAQGWPRYRLANMVPSVGALSRSTVALHEWIGIIWYAVRD